MIYWLSMANPSIAKLEQLFSQTNRLSRLPKKTLILRAQEQPTIVYFLKKGYVRLYTINSSGQEITFNIFKPGSYFPMI